MKSFKLNEEEVRNMTFGSYELKLSSSYAQGHFDGDFEMHVHNDEATRVRLRLPSRHVTSKKY